MKMLRSIHLLLIGGPMPCNLLAFMVLALFLQCTLDSAHAANGGLLAPLEEVSTQFPVLDGHRSAAGFVLAASDSTDARNWRHAYSMNDVGMTMGFWIAQRESLMRIQREFPALSNKAALQIRELNAAFGAGIEEMSAFYGTDNPEWTKAIAVMNANARAMQDEPLSIAEARAFQNDIDARLKGAIPSPILETLLAFQPRYNARPDLEMRDGLQKEVRTKGDPRAKGIDLSIQYPMSWVANAPRRPNVVMSLTSHGGYGDIMMIGLVKTISAEDQKDIEREGGVSEEVLIDIARDMGATPLAQGRTTLAGQSASWNQYIMERENAGVRIKMHVLAYHILRPGKYITLQFQVSEGTMGASLPSDAYMKKKFSKYEPLFLLILMSVDFMDRYD